MTDWGEVVILPPEFVDEIRNEPKLSFGIAAMQARLFLILEIRSLQDSDPLCRTTTRIYPVSKQLPLLVDPTNLFKLWPESS